MWENMKFRNGVLAGLYDFDDCRSSYFLEDIVKTLLFDLDDPVHSLFGTTGENVQAFLDAYIAVRPLSKNESALLPFFFTVGYIYRFTAYIDKQAAGETEYTAKIHALNDQYTHHSSFFLPA
jgi:Ser/Thr protein kinase RdoA (MazF antagonist)